MKKKTTWLAVAFGILVLGYLVFSSMGRPPYRCKICISFKGRSDCGIGAAQSEADAVRTATGLACAQISGGVIETNQCESTPPDSVEWLSKK